MYSLLRSLLFCMDAEKAHHFALKMLNHIPGFMCPKVTGLPVQAMAYPFLMLWVWPRVLILMVFIYPA